MSVSGAGSLADRAARQLGLDAARLAGTGPDGATTLADVLREVGRETPAAARPVPPRAVVPAGTSSEVEAGRGALHLALDCDAKAVRETCGALAAVAAEPPEAVGIVVRLCAAARRDFRGLSEAAFVVRTLDGAETVLPPVPAGGPDRPVGAVLAIAVESESIRLGLELGAGREKEGAAFLERLRSLCLDPRRALL